MAQNLYVNALPRLNKIPINSNSKKKCFIINYQAKNYLSNIINDSTFYYST